MFDEIVLTILEALSLVHPYSLRMTASYNNTQVIAVEQQYLKGIARPAALITGYETMPASIDPPCDVEGTIGATLSFPDASDLISMDLTSVPTVYLGITIADYEVYDWANPAPPITGLPPHVPEILAHIRPALQHVAMIYLRDAGLRVRVAHIHLRDGYNPDENQYALWEAINEQLVTPVNAAITLYRGEKALGGGPPCFLGRAKIPYDFTTTPYNDTFHYNIVHTIAHEFGHIQMLGHAQNYAWPNGTPLEIDDYDNFCPPYDEISLMGYAGFVCYKGGHWSWNGNRPDLRISAPLGPLMRDLRDNILRRQCVEIPTALQLDQNAIHSSGDTDEDYVPSMIDNCKTTYNNNQSDSDLDGTGDACDSCAISPSPRNSAWWLLFPIIPLLLKKKSKEI